MNHRVAIIVAIGVIAGVSCGAALADPPKVNGHNCAGLTSTFVPEEPWKVGQRHSHSCANSDSGIARLRQLRREWIPALAANEPRKPATA
jgi:hypothetical protein